MPLQATSGAASYDAFGGGVPVEPVYIEQIFSTYLYTGNAGTQTITNGIDLSTKGGLTWFKNRTSAANHLLYDTSSDSYGFSNLTAAFNANAGLFVPSTTGISFTVNATTVNTSGNNYASWTFRKQPKFFDVVTYTGNGAVRTLAHNLGSVPGCVLIKCTSLGGTDWMVFHRSASTGYLYLNSTSALMTAGAATFFGNGTSVVAPDATSIYLGSGDGQINQTSATYVAYLFAHNAGGFGLTGTDNVISCGSYTTNGSGVATVDLGYEPQWVLTKAISGTFGTTDWVIADNMRGMPAPPQTDGVGGLFPNLSRGEDNNFNRSVHPTSTGFVANQYASTPYIYISIRRGPMKVPTVGTSVFAPVLNTGTGANTNISSGSFSPDMLWNKNRDHSYGAEVWDKLRGVRAVGLTTSNSGAEGTSPANTDLVSFNNTGVTEGPNSGSVMNITSWLYVNYMFGRAPSFFDVVCYTGTGTQQNISHNLGAVPQLIFVKSRSAGNGGLVYNETITASKYLKLFFSDEGDFAAVSDVGGFAGVTPTSSVFTVKNYNNVNGSGVTYVAYLFATCAGVSKVGSYTGTGTTKQIDCGFTGGARFVLIKRTDSTGDWYVWDTARGIVSGNDSYLLLNTTAAEVTNTDYIDTYSAGFEISSTAPAAINASGGTFIFLAIA